MAFEDNSDLLKDTSTRLPNRNFLSLTMSPQQEVVLESLERINPVAAQAYSAGLYFFKKEDFPLRLFYICHSFYLLSEIFMESDEQAQFEEFKEHMEDNLRKSIKINNWFEDHVCEEIMKRGNTHTKIKDMWDDLRQISMGKSYRWHYFIKRFRPKIKDDDLLKLTEAIKSSMKLFHRGRHYNISKKALLDYAEAIRNLEGFILALEQPYLEAKEVLDGILEDTNTRSD